MRELATTIDRMPVSTWRRPPVNVARLALRGPDDGPRTGEGDLRAPEGIIARQSLDGFAFREDIAGMFVPADVGAFIDENSNRRHLIRIPRGYAAEKPILLGLRLGAQTPALVDDVAIEAEEGSSAVVILWYTSEGGTPVHHCGRARVIAHRGARLKLVKVQMLDADATHTDAVEGLVQESAQLDVIIAELGAARPLSSCNLILEGEGAGAELDVIYLGDGDRSLDISCRVEHRARKTTSEICGKGILLDRSKKVFRDTLDFMSGTPGSRGREEESVLLLSAEARNISVPLLLCGEDDVQGEHAATSGRLDDRVLFYLMSRGISELEAKKLLAQAALSSIVAKIPEAFVRDGILDMVSRAIERAGKTA